MTSRDPADHLPDHRRPRAAGPPRWVNRLVVRTLRSPLHPLLDYALALVTVTGRHTGRPITIPVISARCGQDLVVLVGHAARKSWWRNLEGTADVAVTLRGRRQLMRATVLALHPDRTEALRASISTAFRRLDGGSPPPTSSCAWQDHRPEGAQ